MYAPRQTGIGPVRMTGEKFGSEARLLWPALLALAIGVVVYLYDRGGTAYFVPAWLTRDAPLPIFGAVGKHLPTFVHTFAFIVITAVALWPWPRLLPAICAAWVAIECAFEFGQAQPLGERLAAATPWWFDGVPFLEAAPTYFTSGTFDWLDVLAIGLGAMSAYLLVRYFSKGGMP
jgi:hypothetical protein